jgi:hypothetical protein
MERPAWRIGLARRRSFLIAVTLGALLLGTGVGFIVGRASNEGEPTPNKIAVAPPEQPPGGGISLTRAAAVALRYEGGHVVLATARRIGEVLGDHTAGIPPETWVWVVEVRGTEQSSSCGGFVLSGAPQSCPPPNHSAVAFVDYMTGRWLMDGTPARVFLTNINP